MKLIVPHMIAGGDLRSLLKPPPSKASSWVNSKVICTLGPSTHETSRLEEMLKVQGKEGSLSLPELVQPPEF